METDGVLLRLFRKIRKRVRIFVFTFSFRFPSNLSLLCLTKASAWDKLEKGNTVPGPSDREAPIQIRGLTWPTESNQERGRHSHAPHVS